MHSHRARKRFGQNFLHDPGVVQRIVSAINAQVGEHLVEIGPGLGALTSQLLPIVGDMDVVELDRDLLEPLAQTCSKLGRLRIHSADALRFDFSSLAAPGDKLRIVGNLPYNISTPLMFRLFEFSDVIKDMHFMLQKEVVDRLVAGPGDSSYGRLSIMVHYFCQTEFLFTVGSGAFKPAPKVESAVVRLVPHEQPPVKVSDPQLLAKVVSVAFNQRRKTLRNALKTLLDIGQIESAEVNPAVRPEELDLADFARLAEVLYQSGR